MRGVVGGAWSLEIAQGELALGGLLGWQYAARARQSERLGTWTEEDARMAPQPISDETLDDIKRTAIRIRGVFARYAPNDSLARTQGWLSLTLVARTLPIGQAP